MSAGHAESSGYSDRVEDWALQGFDELLAHLPILPPEERAARARLIWESLGDLEERRGRGIFDGSYTWTHHGKYAASFPSAFLRMLNTSPWIADASGDLVPPNLVDFESLGWKTNPFLLSKIDFKPPIIDQLAKEAGIDPAAIDFLRKHGITSVADLKLRLGINEPPPEAEAPPDGDTDGADTEADVYGDAEDLYGDDMPDIPPAKLDPDGDDGATHGGTRGSGTPKAGLAAGGSKGHSGNGGQPSGSRGTGSTTKGGSTGGTSSRTPTKSDQSRPFISYVATKLSEEDEPDPDGLDQAARMQVEDRAIALITDFEPSLRRTAVGNPGFDLYECDAVGNVIRWVEVKSMTGTLDDRPVGMSTVQFEFARQRGANYWLYVVENATTPDKMRILRIQDPATLTRTFTFDKGWQAVAKELPVTRDG